LYFRRGGNGAATGCSSWDARSGGRNDRGHLRDVETGGSARSRPAGAFRGSGSMTSGGGVVDLFGPCAGIRKTVTRGFPGPNRTWQHGGRQQRWARFPVPPPTPRTERRGGLMDSHPKKCVSRKWVAAGFADRTDFFFFPRSVFNVWQAEIGRAPSAGTLSFLRGWNGRWRRLCLQAGPRRRGRQRPSGSPTPAPRHRRAGGSLSPAGRPGDTSRQASATWARPSYVNRYSASRKPLQA